MTLRTGSRLAHSLAARLSLWCLLWLSATLPSHSLFRHSQSRLPLSPHPLSQPLSRHFLRSARHSTHRARTRPALPSSVLPSLSASPTSGLSRAQARYLKARKTPPPGPCSKTRVTIDVFTEADFQLRLKYKRGRTVVLLLRRNIRLKTGLLLGPSFACTMIRRPVNASNLQLHYPASDMPVITVHDTSNVWIQNIDIKHGIESTADPCPFSLFVAGKELNSVVCPGIYVTSSYAVQINQATVFGRIDVFRSIYVQLDHLKVTSAKVYLSGDSFFTFKSHGFIRMGETSLGNKLVPSNNTISNCEVYGGWELITLYRGAVGVTVTRNYLHDFLFVGVRCGADTGYVMDCHLNNITYNYIWNPQVYSTNFTDVNNAGIYTCTHFFNPGNYLSCNYIYNQRWCYYLDFASSGVTIEGGLCWGSYSSTKVNGGKFNKIRSLIVVRSARFLSFTSCVTITFGNCFQSPGNNWEALRRAHYDTPAINARFPYMRTFCNPIPSTVNGITCNPITAKYTAPATGYCSGFSYGNDVQHFYLYPQKSNDFWSADYNSCKDDMWVTASGMNREQNFNVTTNPGFIGGGTGVLPNIDNFGLIKKSRIYQLYPGFKSCPRSSVGPTTIKWGSTQSFYYKYWNVKEPMYFKQVLNFSFAQILDGSLSVPVSSFRVSGGSTNV